MTLFTDSLTYAFRNNGKYMLIIGAIMHAASSFCIFIPFLGQFFYLLLVAYFSSTYFTIIRSSLTGESQAPPFPGVSNVFDDLILPFFRVLILALLSLSLYSIYTLCKGENQIIQSLLIFIGCIYFPIATLAVATVGHLGAANPAVMIPSIFKTGPLYWLTVGLMMLLYHLEKCVPGVLDRIYLLCPLTLGGFTMYIIMTSARALGLIYRHQKEALDWWE